MYQPKISRIRPSSKTARSRVLRYIFLGIIAMAILIGTGLRLANSDVSVPRFQDPLSQHLYTNEVNFLLRNDDVLVILRGGEPAEFATGYATTKDVCDKLRNVRLPKKVIHYTVENTTEGTCNR